MASDRDTLTDNVGWFEFISATKATTHIAYVAEDGSVYLPEGRDVVDQDDFTFAAARGRVYRLVRADEFAGWRPPAREITTVGELYALPYGAIVLAKYSKPFKLTTLPVGYRWVAEGCSDGWTSQRLFDHYTAAHCPLILLYVPTEEA